MLRQSQVTHALLDLVGISKTYPGVVALDRVDFSVAPGEVVGLIGENGAGKSTLMKILGGVVAPTSGAIQLDGRGYQALTVGDAIAGGIAFVHQELNLFENLDVAGNVLIGREPLWGGPLRLMDRAAMIAQVQPILARLGADFAPDAPLAELSLAQMQLVEIAKALALDARLVILDEPTSSLTLSETERLLRVIAELKAGGVGIVFISHRLHEVERCCDRVVVLRDGRVVGTLVGARIQHEEMIRLMIGRDLRSLYIPPQSPPGSVMLEIDGVRTAAFPERSVSLTVRRGEIVGLAGLVGAGRTELARAVFGIDKMLAGKLRLDGGDVAINSARDAIDQGLYLVPEDRKRSGVLIDMSIASNISLPDLAADARAFLIDTAAEADRAESQKRSLGIRAPGVATPVKSLSGGNQQKVVLAKWLAMRPRALIFDEPTRGIDVGAKGEIYALMRQLADGGVAIIMISSDMEEVIGVSDRIVVMHEGAVSGHLARADFSEQNVLLLAVGKTIAAERAAAGSAA
ncbi:MULTISPECIES: sugar ABC transporter ATP-binding protein [Rhodomicrobium]|uniref:sugar ABC transporter ATP-binding protein n=1 Tax=Rhodomicrobium TaxID=1068 RepID=UPI000B4C0206|nr:MULTISPECIES: sugar ABC transporter ATP-binding protein [Rhodomicrobium]